jgi:uncharacterized membrane protein YhaH (DUF805 family)
MATFPCPSCAKPLDAEPAYRDWTVRCPHCATEFVPEEVARGAFDPRPADPDADADDRDEARERAFGPGLCLELSGWVFGFLIEVGAFVRVVQALILINNPNQQNPNEPPEVVLILGLTFGFLGLPYALVLIVGGRRLRDLSSRSWAVTAAATAVGSVLLVYVLCVCAFVPVLFGVWGLIAVANPAVRRAFAANRWRDPDR